MALKITNIQLQSIIRITTSARFIKACRIIPAMEAGIADHVWSLEEVIALRNGK